MNIETAAELRQALTELEYLIGSVKKNQCAEHGVDPYEAMDANGRPLLADLLVARTNALAVLAHG